MSISVSEDELAGLPPYASRRTLAPKWKAVQNMETRPTKQRWCQSHDGDIEISSLRCSSNAVNTTNWTSILAPLKLFPLHVPQKSPKSSNGGQMNYMTARKWHAASSVLLDHARAAYTQARWRDDFLGADTQTVAARWPQENWGNGWETPVRKYWYHHKVVWPAGRLIQYQVKNGLKDIWKERITGLDRHDLPCVSRTQWRRQNNEDHFWMMHLFSGNGNECALCTRLRNME